MALPRAGLTPGGVADAAARIVDAEGFESLTLARLAGDLGVAAPSLYKHVAGLDDLIVRVTILAVSRLADYLTSAAVGRSERSGLLAVASAYRRFAREHPGLYGLTQRKPGSDSEDLMAVNARAIGVLTAVVKSYGVPAHLLIHSTRLVRAGLHGFADIETRGGFQIAVPVDDSFKGLVDALHASLKRLSAADPASDL